MKLQQFSNVCFPITTIDGYSLTDFSKQSLQKIKLFKTEIPPINNEIFQYIIKMNELQNYHPFTANYAITLLIKYLKKIGNQCKHSIQIISLACFFLSSKIYYKKTQPQPQQIFEKNSISSNDIHNFSNHFFTSNQLLLMEQTILQTLQFNIFTIREECLFDILILMLDIVSPFLPVEKDQGFREICFLIGELIYRNPNKILFNNQLNHIAAGIIQAGLVISTQNVGNFPITWRLSILINLKQEEIMKFGEKILKHVLTKEFCQKNQLF